MKKFTSPILISNLDKVIKKLSSEQKAKLLNKGSYIKKDFYAKQRRWNNDTI